MGDNNYDPGVSRRLALVQKQFKANAAEQKREQATQTRRSRWARLVQNRVLIGRIVLFVVLGAVLLAIILTVILDKI
jgi:hypothetical protein